MSEKPTGCDLIKAIVATLTYEGNKGFADRRFMDDAARVIFAEAARKAAHDAGSAAERGEI